MPSSGNQPVLRTRKANLQPFTFTKQYLWLGDSFTFLNQTFTIPIIQTALVNKARVMTSLTKPDSSITILAKKVILSKD